MKTYTVYTKAYEAKLVTAAEAAAVAGDEKSGALYQYSELPADKRRETAVFVPEAFSWKAIIFPVNFFWAIMNSCWLFLGILLVFFLSSFIMPYMDSFYKDLMIAVKIAIYPFLGVWANDFWRFSLKNRGFQLETVISAKDESEAQLRYFQQSA